MLRYLAIACLAAVVAAKPPVFGTQCAKNQVIHRLTVYDDGGLEAECGPLPCGDSGRHCIDDQTSCRAETDVFSGMRWAANGQSVLLRCCRLAVPNKVYVGTDLVTAGSYYAGGPVPKKELYAAGPEFNYIANVRTEQGGVRVWVYRALCGEEAHAAAAAPKQQQAAAEDDEEYADDEEEVAEQQDEAPVQVQKEEPAAFNPLKYMPQRASTGVRRH